MNKTIETQNPKGLSGTTNPVPGDLLIYIYDAEYFLIEDMPLYLVIKLSQKSTDDLYMWYLLVQCCNNHTTQLIETYSAPRWNKNDDVILHNYVRLSDLLPLDD